MQVRPIKTPVFKEGEDLEAFVARHIKRLPEKAVVVVTSKIVALSEGRTAPLGTPKAKERIIRSESQRMLRTKWGWITIKDGMVMWSAGIDESNADGKIILLPKDSFAAATRLRMALRKRYKLKQLGVLITDSRLFPLRAGTVGVAVGYAGFKGIKDYRGKKDIFGRLLKMSRVDAADSLATAAVYVMGEAAERQPLAIIQDAPLEFQNTVDQKELIMDPETDAYRPLFQKFK